MRDWFEEHAQADVEARRAARLRARRLASTKPNWPAQLSAHIARVVQELRVHALPMECWVLAHREDHPVVVRHDQWWTWHRRPQPEGIDIYSRSIRAWPSPDGAAVWSTGEPAQLLLTKDGRLCWARWVESHAMEWMPETPTAARIAHCEEAADGSLCLVREGEVSFGGFGYEVRGRDDRVVVQVLPTDRDESAADGPTLDLTETLSIWEASIIPSGRRVTLDLRCPNCHGPMIRRRLGGVLLDECSDCEGVFVERSELARLIIDEHDAESREPQPLDATR